jgi:hypothetical protein
MLLACRLAGLSALEAHYAVVNGRTQSGPVCSVDDIVKATAMMLIVEEGEPPEMALN